MTSKHDGDTWEPPLRAVRTARGEGLRETARRATTDPGFLSRIESGQTQPSVRVLYRLALTLELRDLARLLKPYIPPEALDG
jgi:transcriptional regulator with XRE-family HTH domain